MSAARWERLRSDLAARGIGVATLTERSYAESRGGRVVHGVSRSITLRHPAGGVVVIGDQWWNKNPDVWVGWEVCREDAEGLEVKRSRWTKRRSDVVAHVATMLGLLA